jgi:hypothetical protein
VNTVIKIVAESLATEAEIKVNTILAEMEQAGYSLVNAMPITPSGTLSPWKFILYFHRDTLGPEEPPNDEDLTNFMRPPK